MSRYSVSYTVPKFQLSPTISLRQRRWIGIMTEHVGFYSPREPPLFIDLCPSIHMRCLQSTTIWRPSCSPRHWDSGSSCVNSGLESGNRRPSSGPVHCWCVKLWCVCCSLKCEIKISIDISEVPGKGQDLSSLQSIFSCRRPKWRLGLGIPRR